MVKIYTGRDRADAVTQGEEMERERISRKRPVENEVAAWWGPDEVEDEGGGDKTKGGADEQDGDPVDSMVGGGVVHGNAGGKGAARVVFGGEGATVARGAADTARGEAREMRVANGSCYGDTEVWAWLLAESSRDIWARTRGGVNIARWRGRSERGAEAAAGRERGHGGRVVAKLRQVRGRETHAGNGTAEVTGVGTGRDRGWVGAGIGGRDKTPTHLVLSPLGVGAAATTVTKARARTAENFMLRTDSELRKCWVLFLTPARRVSSDGDGTRPSSYALYELLTYIATRGRKKWFDSEIRMTNPEDGSEWALDVPGSLGAADFHLVNGGKVVLRPSADGGEDGSPTQACAADLVHRVPRPSSWASPPPTTGAWI
ncbi:hypothetical protein DFH08DRAFT_817457 [Mycena albidolilacea]|uniref:Uncharacterized protein n=1 Tax=Mycena albidolilacea TaxID=1033008 RepID=A0AAD6ZIG6_9AGAR|nr:hypothetical protein DFH08DRAFT_817457 [Mycena albidolilacea]